MSGLLQLRSVMQSLDIGNAAAAAERMKQTLVQAAQAAGMRLTQGAGAERVMSRQKPWFDSACRRLKAAVTAARSAQAGVSSPDLRQACKASKKAARYKRRRFIQHRLTELLTQLAQPDQCKRFWNALCLPAQRLPEQLCSPFAWTSAMQKALSSAAPDFPLEPEIMEGSSPPAEAGMLAGAITREQVIQGMTAMKNYKASGVGGCPAELLKYGLLPSDDPDFRLPDEADLACHLTRLFNIVYEAGEVPRDWNTVLVTPIFKRGDKAFQANYRPILGSETFEQLYAIVLNARGSRALA